MESKNRENMKHLPEKFNWKFVMGDRELDKNGRVRTRSLIGVAKIYLVLKLQCNSTSSWACLEILWKGECPTVISVYARRNGWANMKRELTSCLKNKRCAIIDRDLNSKKGCLDSVVEDTKRLARVSEHNCNGVFLVYFARTTASDLERKL